MIGQDSTTPEESKNSDDTFNEPETNTTDHDQNPNVRKVYVLEYEVGSSRVPIINSYVLIKETNKLLVVQKHGYVLNLHKVKEDWSFNPRNLIPKVRALLNQTAEHFRSEISRLNDEIKELERKIERVKDISICQLQEISPDPIKINLG